MNNDDLQKEVDDLKREVKRIGKNQNNLFHRIRTVVGYFEKISPYASIRDLVERIRRARAHLRDVGEEGEDNEQ